MVRVRDLEHAPGFDRPDRRESTAADALTERLRPHGCRNRFGVDRRSHTRGGTVLDTRLARVQSTVTRRAAGHTAL